MKPSGLIVYGYKIMVEDSESRPELHAEIGLSGYDGYVGGRVCRRIVIDGIGEIAVDAAFQLKLDIWAGLHIPADIVAQVEMNGAHDRNREIITAVLAILHHVFSHSVGVVTVDVDVGILAAARLIEQARLNRQVVAEVHVDNRPDVDSGSPGVVVPYIEHLLVEITVGRVDSETHSEVNQRLGGRGVEEFCPLRRQCGRDCEKAGKNDVVAHIPYVILYNCSAELYQPHAKLILKNELTKHNDMKIIHASDLHLGQVIYQHYDRADEHERFFSQLEGWCRLHEPDALIVTGDIFDIQQPSANVWLQFTRHFIRLRKECPGLRVILLAGNHDSPSRLHSHKLVWEEVGTTIVAFPPAADVLDQLEGWEEEFIIRLPSGYVVALPYMAVAREEVIQHLLDTVEKRNSEGLPVVMTGHLTVKGCDVTGHDLEIGNIKSVELGRLGTGYDYLALGHIHRAQTLGHAPDNYEGHTVSYPSPVARYAGSALHVSCDETYPHSVSLVEIDHRCGTVSIRPLIIDQLRHFHTLPLKGNQPITQVSEALSHLEALDSMLADSGEEGYVRFRMDNSTNLSADFDQRVYALIENRGNRLRYNPKIEWTGTENDSERAVEAPRFEVAELQQMTDPMQFIEKTIDQYDDLSLEILRDAFDEIREEVRRIKETPTDKKKRKK